MTSAWREKRNAARRSLARDLLEQPKIGAAVYGEAFPLASRTTRNRPWFKSNGTRQSVWRNRIEKQQQFPRLTISGGIARNASVPDELAECEGARCFALEHSCHGDRNHHSLKIWKLRVRFHVDRNNLPSQNSSRAPNELVEIGGHSLRTLLRKAPAMRSTGGRLEAGAPRRSAPSREMTYPSLEKRAGGHSSAVGPTGPSKVYSVEIVQRDHK